MCWRRALPSVTVYIKTLCGMLCMYIYPCSSLLKYPLPYREESTRAINVNLYYHITKYYEKNHPSSNTSIQPKLLPKRSHLIQSLLDILDLLHRPRLHLLHIHRLNTTQSTFALYIRHLHILLVSLPERICRETSTSRRYVVHW